MLDGSDDFVPLELLMSRQVGTAVGGDVTAPEHVECTFELRRKILIKKLSRLLGSSLNGVAGRLIHGARRSLDNHLLAGSDQARTLLPNAGKSRVELFLRFNPAGEVAAQPHRRDAITVDDAVNLCDGVLKTCLAGIQLRAKLRDRNPLLVPHFSARQRGPPASAAGPGQFHPSQA